MDYNEVISNVNVYGLENALIVSGYPMATETGVRDEVNEKDLKRAKNLVAASDKDNAAHAQFLSGITVTFDLTLTTKAWVEAERYRFLTFISSESQMHRLPKFNLDVQYIEYVDPRMIEIMKEKINRYNYLLNRKPEDNEGYNDNLKRLYLELLYSNPQGFKLTAGMVTNYRCLRNIYRQRKDHRLPEWRAFCDWVETLPMADELLIKDYR